jgi:O-antigen ligase
MSFLIFIAVVVGLVWGTIYTLRGSLVAGCLAVVLVTYCFGHFFVNFDLGPLPLTLDRLAVGGLLAAFFVKLRFGTADPKPMTAADWLLAAFLGVLVVSTFTHSWRLARPGMVSPLWLLVAAYLIPAAIYFVSRNARLTESNVKMVYASMALFGVYLAITALSEITQQWWLVYPSYISDPELGIHYGRARGPMLQSQSLGFYLGVALVGVWAWRREASRLKQLAAIPLIALLAAALFFSYTRCAWLGAALGGGIVLACWLQGAWRGLALTGALLAGIAIAVFGMGDIAGIERDAGSVAARDSVTQRASFTYVSWTMFLDRPLWGVGFGQFPEAKLPYLSDRSVPLHLEAIRKQPHHNTFLSILTETGLVGLSLYLLVLAAWARVGWRMWRDLSAPAHVRTQGLVMVAALGVYLGPALFFDLAYSPQDHLLLFLMAGLTMGLRPQSAAARAPAAASPFATHSGSHGAAIPKV